MTGLTLYHIPDWASSIIRLALEEIGQPYSIAAMDWDAGDFDAAAFRAINPLGLLPAMDTPEGPIFETAEARRLALERLNEQAAHLETLITTRAPDWLSTRQAGALGYYLGIILRWAIDLPEDAGYRFSLRPFPALHAVLAAHEAYPAALRVTTADAPGPHPFTAPESAA